MRANGIAVRAALVCAAAGLTLAVWSAADDSTAHAADHRQATTEQPGGLLGRANDLPEQAADRAHEVVDQVVPDRAEQDEPEPVEEPAAPPPPPPAPEAEPTQESPPSTEPADEPATEPRTAEPAPAPSETPAEPDTDSPTCEGTLIDGVCQVAEVVTTSPPAPAAPLPAPPSPVTVPEIIDDVAAVILPSTGPAPLPDAEAPVLRPILRVLPAPPLPLPVPIGPLAVEAVEEPAATVGELPTAATEMAADDPDCATPERPDRRIYDGLNPRPHPARHHAVRQSCPDRPGHPASPHIDCAPSTAPASPSASQDLAASLAAGLPGPVLVRWHRTLPRSTLPAGRTTHLDPRPA